MAKISKNLEAEFENLKFQNGLLFKVVPLYFKKLYKKVAGPEPKIGFSFKDLRAISKLNFCPRVTSKGKEREKILKFKTKKTTERVKRNIEKIKEIFPKISFFIAPKTKNKVELKSKINQAVWELIKIKKNKERKIWTKNKILISFLEIKNKIKIKGKIEAIKIAKELGVPTVLKELNLEKSKGKINFPKIWKRAKINVKIIEIENQKKSQNISSFWKRLVMRK